MVDLREWASSADWTHSDRSRQCGRCNRSFTGRQPTKWCRPCRGMCSHGSIVRGVIVLRDGQRRPAFACHACGGLETPSKRDSGRWTGDIVFRDLRVEQEHVGVPCARCGEGNGTQLHHWAPRAIFGADAELWPRDWLCVPCHRRWHRAIRETHGYRRDSAWESRPFDLFASGGGEDN